jgi:hypothetical protein
MQCTSTRRLNYEKAVVEAHKQKIMQLEEAHRAREADWHDLANKWKSFETNALAENSRYGQGLQHDQVQV